MYLFEGLIFGRGVIWSWSVGFDFYVGGGKVCVRCLFVFL